MFLTLVPPVQNCKSDNVSPPAIPVLCRVEAILPCQPPSSQVFADGLWTVTCSFSVFPFPPSARSLIHVITCLALLSLLILVICPNQTTMFGWGIYVTNLYY